MPKILNYIYYKLYSFSLKTRGRNTAETSATLYLTSIVMFYSLAGLMLIIFEFDMIGKLSKSFVNLFGISTVIISYWIFYVYFEKNDRYLKIIQEYEKESDTQRIIGNFWVAIFSIGSIISFFGVIFWPSIRKHF